MKPLLPLALLGSQLVAQNPNQLLDPTRWMTLEQKKALVKRLIIDQEPFLQSAEASAAPGSLGLFFRHEDYKGLHGNPAIGYYRADSEFQWVEGQKEISFTPFKCAPGEAQRIKPEAWTRAMEIISKRRGWKVVPEASVRITGMCVYAKTQPNPKMRNPMVTVEMRIASPKGTILFRKTHTAPTVGDAIGSCLDFVLGFASTFGQGEPALPKRG